MIVRKIASKIIYEMKPIVRVITIRKQLNQLFLLIAHKRITASHSICRNWTFFFSSKHVLVLRSSKFVNWSYFLGECNKKKICFNKKNYKIKEHTVSNMFLIIDFIGSRIIGFHRFQHRQFIVLSLASPYFAYTA